MNAKTTLSVLAVTMLLGSAGLAEQTPKAAPDLCKDAVDPYNPVAERGRFFAAAGVDNEIDAKEFETNRTHRDPFVRRFDQWAGVLRFDKNDSKTIDWFEADTYRQDVRKRILGAYDGDRDARLKGTERETANRALSEGKIPRASKLPSLPGTVVVRTPGRGESVTVAGGSGEGERPPIFRADYRKLYKEYDKDGDGKMSREEYRDLAAAVQNERKKWELEHYDANGDGTVDDGERKAIEETRKRYYAQMRERWTIRRWDRNKDGRLDEEELAAKKAQEDQSRRRAEEYRR
ncbi:MAG TPA: EF-hand domain-containing protein, partial [Phycisphaerae bacterium]|nr:EF-hand domain-containing protein [Phycisphaerae bacterium]